MWAKRLLIAVFAGCSLARNGSKGSTPAVRFRKREQPESAQTCRYSGDQRMRRIAPFGSLPNASPIVSRGWKAVTVSPHSQA